MAIVDFVGDVAVERAGERRRIAHARDREYAARIPSSRTRRISYRFDKREREVDTMSRLAGVEEDVGSLVAPYGGTPALTGGTSERRGIDRIGTLSGVVPRRNHCKFEDWLALLLGRMQDVRG